LALFTESSNSKVWSIFQEIHFATKKLQLNFRANQSELLPLIRFCALPSSLESVLLRSE
jgi:hypothetical protein